MKLGHVLLGRVSPPHDEADADHLTTQLLSGLSAESLSSLGVVSLAVGGGENQEVGDNASNGDDEEKVTSNDKSLSGTVFTLVAAAGAGEEEDGGGELKEADESSEHDNSSEVGRKVELLHFLVEVGTI